MFSDVAVAVAVVVFLSSLLAAARGESFRIYHLPVLSAEQNDSQSEKINVIDESNAENRSVPVRRKFSWLAVLFVVLSGRSKDSLRCPLTVPVACK